MRHLVGRLVLGFVLGLGWSWFSHAGEVIRGVGSSAAQPIYRLWAEHYAQAGGGALDYDPAGSTAGLQFMRTRLVDFGASDVAPSPQDCARDDIVVVPTAITGAVPVVNLPKVRDRSLVLDAATLASIFMGEINRWDDPRVQRLNPGLSLPSLRIIPVVRSDGSGTTYHFSNYLANAIAGWRTRMGVGTQLPWPADFVAVKGSRAIAETVSSLPGSIGYVDFSYVVAHALSGVKLRVADGDVVEAGPNAFRSALMSSTWPTRGDFTSTLTGQNGKGAWPITMGTFVLLSRTAPDVARTSETLRFFTWAFMHGDRLVDRALFVRLPDVIQAKSYRALAEVRDHNGASIVTGPGTPPR